MVAHNRKARVLEMNPDLMIPMRERMARERGVAGKFLHDVELRLGFHPVAIINPHHAQLSNARRDLGIHYEPI